MRDQDKPMPLSELTGYIDSVRDRGQGDDIPVVEMGMIVDAPSPWRRRLAYGAAASVLFLALGAYAFNSTGRVTIVSDAASPRSISEMVADGGGRVISVMQEEDGTYKVRVFHFGGMRSLVERLRENKELNRVEAEE